MSADAPVPPAPFISWAQLIQLVLSLTKVLGPQAEPILSELLADLEMPSRVVKMIEQIIHMRLGKSGFVIYTIKEE